MSQRIWAVEHLLGVSLIVAENGLKAAKIAEKEFGLHVGPYRVPRSQAQAILLAQSMGARVLNPTEGCNDETLHSGNHFRKHFDSKPRPRRRNPVQPKWRPKRTDG